MATISNTPRPGYVWDSTDNVWYPIGVGGHSHSEIAKTIADAKGDLIVGTAADTVDRLAVGNNGDSLVADSSTATGLRYKEDYAAGKNQCINGAFNVWQRGTSFAGNVYTADRWQTQTNKTLTVSQQTFTPGTAPVAGYESAFFLRQTYSADGSYGALQSKLEDVRLFAGQTITFSYWAKADATVSNTPSIVQNFGSGGSTQTGQNGTTHNITTSWARYSSTIAIASISGKTIGTSSYFMIQPILLESAGARTIDIWGVQIEESPVATAFQTATGTIQGELAACQRYYQIAGDTIYEIMDGGYMVSGNVAYPSWIYAVPMRTTPTGTVVGSWAVSGVGQPTLQASQQRGFCLRATSNATGAYYFHSNTTYYLTFSAEL